MTSKVLFGSAPMGALADNTALPTHVPLDKGVVCRTFSERPGAIFHIKTGVP